jgi:hypothetical protein
MEAERIIDNMPRERFRIEAYEIARARDPQLASDLRDYAGS